MSVALPGLLARNVEGISLPFLVVLISVVLLCSLLVLPFFAPKLFSSAKEQSLGFVRFFYASFVKPHSGDKDGGQQGALESFYKAQGSHDLLPSTILD